jgi:hypothetical protein
MTCLWVASLVRNEANRFLPRALDVWRDLADEILVLDDCSDDGSDEIARRAGAYVSCRFPGMRAWGTEAPARRELWDLAWNSASEGDYILFLDADMIPARNPRPLMDTEADSVFFVLYDLWSPTTYREDDFWQGHLHHRLWMVRKRETNLAWTWSARGIHTGHVPLNYPLGTVAFAPPDFGLLHGAYMTPELRRAKHDAYLSVSAQLAPHEIAHARTIIDETPATFPLPFAPEYTLS